MDNSIEIKELNKFYGRKKQALSNVNLTIEQGMFGKNHTDENARHFASETKW